MDSKIFNLQLTSVLYLTPSFRINGSKESSILWFGILTSESTRINSAVPYFLSRQFPGIEATSKQVVSYKGKWALYEKE